MIDLRKHLPIISVIKKDLQELYGGGKLIFLTISGADLYGFRSKDSDIDYRGAFACNPHQLLGLHRPKDVYEKQFDENDIVLFELSRAIGLALKSNCNELEHWFSIPLVSTPEYWKLKPVIGNIFGKEGLYNSYKGMAVANYKKFILGGKPSIKKYLYIFRGLMAGIYVLQTGQILSDLQALNLYFQFDEVQKLLYYKRIGKESDTMPPELDAKQLGEKINWLFGKIDEAYVKSSIPNVPDEDDVEKVNRQLMSIRKSMLRMSC